MKQKSHTVETLRDHTVLSRIVDSLARSSFPISANPEEISRSWSILDIDVDRVIETVNIEPKDVDIVGVLLLATLRWRSQIRHLSYYIMAVEGSGRLFMLPAPGTTATWPAPVPNQSTERR